MAKACDACGGPLRVVRCGHGNMLIDGHGAWTGERCAQAGEHTHESCPHCEAAMVREHREAQDEDRGDDGLA